MYICDELTFYIMCFDVIHMVQFFFFSLYDDGYNSKQNKNGTM